MNKKQAYTQKLNTVGGIFIIAMVLNMLFVIVEAGVGIWSNSMGLLSDAGHKLGDSLSLMLALLAFQLAKLHGNKHFTYGLKKSTVLISLVNAIILLAAVTAIFFGSINRLYAPESINGEAMSWTAGIGIAINGISALLLMKNQKKDLNVKVAFIHAAADTLLSTGVVISGIIITITGCSTIDPIISIIIAVAILISTCRLLKASLRLTLDGTPLNVDFDEVEKTIASTPHVESVHHLHIWAISTTENALTAHVVIDDINQAEPVKEEIKNHLAQNGITHPTLEMETCKNKCNKRESGC